MGAKVVNIFTKQPVGSIKDEVIEGIKEAKSDEETNDQPEKGKKVNLAVVVKVELQRK